MKRAALKLKLPETTWRMVPRWEWEESGQILVIALDGIPQNSMRAVFAAIRKMLAELNLPLTVSEEQKPGVRDLVMQCIDAVKICRQLDPVRFVERINQQRRTTPELGIGLVILLNPNAFDPFGKPGNTQWGIYGESHDDGVCLLRAFHEEAVRHEVAHMLGLGEHCPNSKCVMRWECPTRNFCQSCMGKLREICEVQLR